MRRRHEPSGSQAESQDMERMAGGTGSSSDVPGSTGSTTGATSSGMQDTGSSTYQQQGPYQQGTYQQGSGTQTTAYGQGRAPAPAGQYGTSGYDDRPPASRHGAALSILAGALAFLEGLAYVIRSHYYHALPGYPYAWALHGWGWTLLILGALLIAGGVAHIFRLPWSRQFTATIAIITAVVAFLTLFYSVVWGIVVIAACGFAAHSLLSKSGMEGEYPSGGGMGYGAGGQDYGYQQGTVQGSTGQEAMSGGKRSRG